LTELAGNKANLNPSGSRKEKRLALRWPSFYLTSTVLIALIVAVPILTVISFIFNPATDTWQHLVDTVLRDYISNSLLLMLGVAVGAGSIGVTTAWLVSTYEFPGRSLFTWSLLLPLAIPAYIIAYTYTGMLEAGGPVQSWIRESFELSYGQYWFPEVRSLLGAVCMFSLVLYPYVYLLARSAFLDQSVCALEAARTLGCGPWRSFFSVALPLARPAIVAGMSLALMETLADYGTVQFFGISTFTTGIFRTWFSLFDETAAGQLAALLLSFVFVLIMLERWSRKRSKFHHSTNRYQSLPSIKLSRRRALICTILCLTPLLLGFVLPFIQLVVWALMTWQEMIDKTFVSLVKNSFLLAGGASFITLIAGLLLAYGNRIKPNKMQALLTRLSAMGYAIPGTVIAIGVMIPFGKIDNAIDAWLRSHFNYSSGLIFSGTIFILLFAYTVRFLSVSLQTVESGLGHIRPSMDEASRSMGYSSFETLRYVHLPIMKGSLLTALIIVFVDVLKELPATLVLRPFNFNTLAVRAFELASDERLADASTAAIAIVLAGIVPVIILSRTINLSRAGYVKHS
jgi:iron(III) transport system permease protein